MKVSDLSPTTLKRLRKKRYDNYIRKHEGPETWEWELEPMEPNELTRIMDPDFKPENHMAEFIEVSGEWVLLPIERKRHAKLSVIHHFFSRDMAKLVLYLKDSNFGSSPFDTGFIAICDLFLPEKFYVATFYHKWYMIDYDEGARQFFKIED